MPSVNRGDHNTNLQRFLLLREDQISRRVTAGQAGTKTRKIGKSLDDVQQKYSTQYYCYMQALAVDSDGTDLQSEHLLHLKYFLLHNQVAGLEIKNEV